MILLLTQLAPALKGLVLPRCNCQTKPFPAKLQIISMLILFEQTNAENTCVRGNESSHKRVK